MIGLREIEGRARGLCKGAQLGQRGRPLLLRGGVPRGQEHERNEGESESEHAHGDTDCGNSLRGEVLPAGAMHLP